MPTPRDRRLQADYDKVQKLAAGSSGHLRLVSVRGSPPSAYILEYHCPGLFKKKDGSIDIATMHRVEIVLGSDYPMFKPQARMLTPAYNPHIFTINNSFCLGGDWSPVHTLDMVVEQIGSILQLDPRVMNFKSLANGDAGRWLLAHPQYMPLPGMLSLRKAVKS